MLTIILGLGVALIIFSMFIVFSVLFALIKLGVGLLLLTPLGAIIFLDIYLVYKVVKKILGK